MPSAFDRYEHIDVLGGDFGWALFYPRTKEIELSKGRDRLCEKLPDVVESMEQIDEEQAGMKAGVGWGVAGAVVAGPVGALAGALLGGMTKRTVFLMTLKDGRKMMGRTSPKIFNLMRAALL